VQSTAPPGNSKRTGLDAIIVPGSRPASFLQPVIELSALLGVLLIVLCSKQTSVEQVATRVLKTPGARSLVIGVPDDWNHPGIPSRTSASTFKNANAYRQSDLSAKRNLGLLLARLHGWNKIAFIDDDVMISEPSSLARLAGQLDQYQVAGMLVRKHPDNSVVCHARRLAGQTQDVFVTGAVLGVHCNSLPVSFFPDVYNEDWFFFAKEAAARKLPCVGQARQIAYDPFASPERARKEEFGDLLGEGLYALIGQEDPSVPFVRQLHAASASYWSRFIEARREVLCETMTLLRGFLEDDPDHTEVSSALDSLAAAHGQLDKAITAELCVDFIIAWREDIIDWQRFSNAVNNVGSTREAMDFLQLTDWTLAGFGALADTKTARGWHRVR
jgi:hypothetical protein